MYHLISFLSVVFLLTSLPVFAQDMANTDATTPLQPVGFTVYQFEATIFLSSGEMVTGQIQMNHTTLRIPHTVNGIRYVKAIQYNDIQTLEITQWTKRERDFSTFTDERTNHVRFDFHPTAFEITTYEGERYIHEGRIPQLEALSFRNADGNTVLYSFFVDYWVKESWDRGYWLHSEEEDFNYNDRHPHEQSFFRIDFDPRAPMELNVTAPD
jgi:hypothetical protein